MLNCRCAIKTCIDVGNPLNVCPALIDCICPEKIPSTKLGFLRKQRIRGGGAQEPFIHPSKFRDSRIELHFEQTDSAMKETNKTVLSLDSSFNPKFDEITMESEVSRNANKFCNLCLEEMRQQTLNEAEEIASEVLDKIVSIATKSKCQETGPLTLNLDMPSAKNISSNSTVKTFNDNDNGLNTKVQQIRFTSGELMWALSIGAEPIPGK